jgi:hypothetical protein
MDGNKKVWKKILAKNNWESWSLKAQKEGCKEANVYKYSEVKVDIAG